MKPIDRRAARSHPPQPLVAAPRRARLAALLTLGLAALGACSVSVETDQPVGLGDDPSRSPVAADVLVGARLVDLTHPLSPDSLYWPNGSPFEYTRDAWGVGEDGAWYAMGSFAQPEHLGTHLDAPVHFAEGRWSSSEIPVEHFIAPAVLVDISDRADADPDSTLQPQDLDRWESDHGQIPVGAILLVRTGWSERWPDWNAYYGSDDPFDTTSLHFPGVSPEAAAAIVERGFVGVGIDTASIDPGNDLLFRAHRVLAEANLFNLENLTGLDALPERGATLLALPIKIEGGSGGPARVIGVLPE